MGGGETFEIRAPTSRLVVGVIWSVALVGILLGTAGQAKAAFPGANGKIAFSSNRDGDYDIYTIDADGSGLAQLTNDPATDAQPAWSADGGRITFARGSDIWVMNGDGTGQTKLLDSFQFFQDPTWSPDGQKIAFAYDDHCGGTLIGLDVMNADGTNPTNLTCTGGRYNRFPSWSPDGQTIAFSAGLPDTAIFVIKPDGSALAQLTTGPGESFGDLYPDWSPDGTKIAFYRTPYSGTVGIFVMNPNGSGQARITSGSDLQPAWSPDGTRIAFTKALCEATCNNELYTMNPDGSNQVPVTADPANDVEPAWQPIGNPVQQADLSITKSDSPDPVAVGAELTYTLSVANAGPSPSGATVTDTLPAGVTFVSATPPAGGSCSEASGTVTCQLADVPVGGAANVAIKVTPQNANTTITNSASVSAFLPDPDPGDNGATETTTVVTPTADLVVTNTDSPDPVHVGELLTYTIQVQNAGPLGASGVMLTDAFTKRVRVGSVDASQGNCTLRRETVTCRLDDVAAGASATVTITLRPTRAKPITTTASASAANPPDPNTANNTATATTTVLK